MIGLFDRVRGEVGSDPPAAIEHALDTAGTVEAVRLRYPNAGGGALLTLVLDRSAPAPRIDAIELEMGQ